MRLAAGKGPPGGLAGSHTAFGAGREGRANKAQVSPRFLSLPVSLSGSCFVPQSGTETCGSCRAWEALAGPQVPDQRWRLCSWGSPPSCGRVSGLLWTPTLPAMDHLWGPCRL